MPLCWAGERHETKVLEASVIQNSLGLMEQVMCLSFSTFANSQLVDRTPGDSCPLPPWYPCKFGAFVASITPIQRGNNTARVTHWEKNVYGEDHCPHQVFWESGAGPKGRYGERCYHRPRG